MSKNIIIYPDPILLAKSQPVVDFDQTVRDTLNEMVRIMEAYQGVGLAAPQIGISKRLITVNLNKRLYQIVNPVIVWQDGKNFDVEGCLSVPDEFYEVCRSMEIVLYGYNAHGKEISVSVDNLLARIFQHEIDHLDGILINSKGVRCQNESRDS